MVRITATTSIVQSDFGIQPYSALFGALRVRDVVEVVVEARIRSPSAAGRALMGRER